MRRFAPALRIGAIFLAFGLVWILVSDVLVAWLTGASGSFVSIQMAKGAAFVAVSAVVIFLLVHRERRRWRATEGRLAAVFESLMDGVLLLSWPERRILVANPAAAELLGWPAEELAGRPVSILYVNQESYAEAAREADAALGAGGTHRDRVTMRRRDGSTFLAERSIRLVEEKGAERRVAVLALRDVSQTEEAERALEESRRRFLRAFEASPLPSAISTLAAGRILEVNRAFLTLFGARRDEVVGRTGTGLGVWSDPGDRERVMDVVRTQGRARGLEARVRTRAGEPRDVLLFVEPLGLAEGNEELLLTMALDVTERRRVEGQLLQAQKMEAVGRLAGGVAHDFNNILTGVGGFARLAFDALPSDSPVRGDLAEILRAVERGASLVQQLLAFSRRQVVQPRVLDVNEELRSMARLVQHLVREDVDVRLELEPEVGAVRLDPVQLEQIVMNLAVNARDAIPQGGRLSLRTRAVELGPERVLEMAPALQPGSYVSLEVEDTGLGMEPEVLDRIFEPFFTTKKEGEGTGLGLSTVYAIVSQAGGHVEARSVPGQGTCFEILLPRTTERPETTTGAQDQHPGGTEWILVAEDNVAVRRLVERTLRQAGYRVLVAENGEAALRAASDHTGRIDLLLTDVVMPGVGGRELADRLGRLRPGLRVLYMSGYTEDAVIRRGVSAGEPLLRKPFGPAALLTAVRAALDRPPPARDLSPDLKEET